MFVPDLVRWRAYKAKQMQDQLKFERRDETAASDEEAERATTATTGNSNKKYGPGIRGDQS